MTEVPLYHTFSVKPPIKKIWIDLGSREGLLVMEKHVPSCLFADDGLG
ncbi:hypothetical protein WJ0W_003446 [Paenibacillus melissococcoides]|uniref:Uncharacterized protein n=1 Tax=Paenibacillus melissococcoides TaxID=2912268 RepID=A0ABN8U9Q0_9BACL|nr:hypothetical protein WJ0W_003446 [Paenibacillus melissococcoides]